MKSFLIMLLSASFGLASAQNINLYSDKGSGKVIFAASEIEQALKEKGTGISSYANSETGRMNAAQFNIVLISLNEKIAAGLIKKAGIKNVAGLKNEGFLIRRAGPDQKTIYVLGYDEAGTMYGGIEVAEIIRIKGIEAVQDQMQNPT